LFVEQELRTRVEREERHCTELQQICDDRLLVIEGLAEAAQERLALANELSGRVRELQRICEERQAVIDELQRAATERLGLIGDLTARLEATV
jgi:hypothetical protein